jgi:hypothetical protein
VVWISKLLDLGMGGCGLDVLPLAGLHACHYLHGAAACHASDVVSGRQDATARLPRSTGKVGRFLSGKPQSARDDDGRRAGRTRGRPRHEGRKKKARRGQASAHDSTSTALRVGTDELPCPAVACVRAPHAQAGNAFRQVVQSLEVD